MDILTPGFAPRFLPFQEGWTLQRKVHAGVVSGERPDALILLEHESVYTAGARTARGERPTGNTPVIDVDRGGKITWHGPGQLVGYPIVRLPDPVDVVAHVRRLEGILMDVLAHFDIIGYRVEGRSGVWVCQPHGEDKIAAIGVRVQRGVTMHGFALNCDNSLTGFEAIVPCGITDAGVTTMSIAAGSHVGVSDVVDTVIDAFAAQYSAVSA